VLPGEIQRFREALFNIQHEVTRSLADADSPPGAFNRAVPLPGLREVQLPLQENGQPHKLLLANIDVPAADHLATDVILHDDGHAVRMPAWRSRWAVLFPYDPPPFPSILSTCRRFLRAGRVAGQLPRVSKPGGNE